MRSEGFPAGKMKYGLCVSVDENVPIIPQTLLGASSATHSYTDIIA